MTIYNKEYANNEFEHHGETQLQRHLSGKLNTIFDVGSNIGEWTNMARRYNPSSEIHMFEIVYQTYKDMLINTELDTKILPNGFGLSDENGTLDLKYDSNYSALSSSMLNLRLDGSVIVSGLTIKGDDYVKSRNISYIDYLKIDVEGAEHKVLKGFYETLNNNKVGIIQFEYNRHCILNRFLLIDFYEMLKPFGFNIGKLTPNGIHFHEYTLLYETFNGPDYVAVHATKMNLVENFLNHKDIV